MTKLRQRCRDVIDQAFGKMILLFPRRQICERKNNNGAAQAERGKGDESALVARLCFGLNVSHETISAPRERSDHPLRFAAIANHLESRRDPAVDGGIRNESSVPYRC